jgi:hypothetical protein
MSWTPEQLRALNDERARKQAMRDTGVDPAEREAEDVPPGSLEWHPSTAFPEHQQRDLHDSPYWAEVSPDGSWGILSPDQDGDVTSGRAADMTTAKHAVANWETAHQQAAGSS